MLISKTLRLLPLISLASLLVACGGSSGSSSDDDDDDTPVTAEFEIEVVNATAAQPFSPLTVAFHAASKSLWQIGEPSSMALEKMAEGGDNADLLASLATAYGSASGAGLIMPGNSETVRVETELAADLRFSITTMLVNTNDAFAGLGGIDVSDWQVGDSMQWPLPLYDAGTEFNSEADGSIPGPADGGEGFNENRDDVMNKVSRHPGLVTQADEPTSVLSPSHRVAGTTAYLMITRVD